MFFLEMSRVLFLCGSRYINLSESVREIVEIPISFGNLRDSSDDACSGYLWRSSGRSGPPSQISVRVFEAFE